METIQAYLEKLTQETNRDETEIMAEAIRFGLRQLWREHVLGCFLRGELDRAGAIEQVGLDWVEVAERQHQAAQEDLVWGLVGWSKP
jgi:hypothetical protein